MKNYYIERNTLEIFKKDLEDLSTSFYCARMNKDDDEIKRLEAKKCALIMEMNDIDMTINTKFHVKIDGKFRCFDNTEFDVPIRLGDVNYIIGPNGSGKSTILQTIRANKDSLFEMNKSELDGMTSQNIKLLKTAPISITGIKDKFTHVFALDAIEDDPSSFINSATALSFINGGGLMAQQSSKGQKSKDMLGRLFTKMQKVLNFTIEDYKNDKHIEDSASLIIIDEIDEGMDLEYLFKFDKLLNNMCCIFNGTVLCVTHNPLVCYGNKLRGDYPVFDFGSFSEIKIKDYIQNKTGLKFEVYD